MTNTLRQNPATSHDMLDLAEKLLLEAGNIGAAGNTIFDHGAVKVAIDDARAAALRVLSTVNQIEGIAS